MRLGRYSRFVAILLAIVLVDLSATAYAMIFRPANVTELPQLGPVIVDGPLRPGVDAYDARPAEFDFTTTPGRPTVPDSGHVRVLVKNRERLDPDESLRYALAALATPSAARGEGPWLGRARTAVREVLAERTKGMARHQVRATDLAGERLPPGWVSAETQGLLLSALTRLYEITDNPTWRLKADTVFDSLLRFRGGRDDDGDPYDPWLTLVDAQGFLWFEDMPQATSPTTSLTGHLAAVLGIYDYLGLRRGGDRRKTAVKLFRAGASTGLHYAPEVRFRDGAAWTSPLHQTRSFELHRTLVAQLDTLAAITGLAKFSRYANRLRADSRVPPFTTTGLSPKGDVDAYAGPNGVRALPPTDPPSVPDPAGPEREPRTAARPDTQLAGAIETLGAYAESGDRAQLDSAVRTVDEVLDTTTQGMVPHEFPLRYLGKRKLVDPWYSAQTQGLLLSALVRLADATGEQRWSDEAGAVFASLQLTRTYPVGPQKEPPAVWMSYVGDETSKANLWFEKYSRQVGNGYVLGPSFVVDAHIAAVVGIYDYWRLTKSPTAAALFDGGVSTIVDRLPDIRQSGGISSTALHSNVARLDHHEVVTRQVALLAEMTGDKLLATYAQRLEQDAP